MKVLHLSSSDLAGGAARGAYRLHSGLRAFGIESFLAVQRKLSDDYTVLGPNTSLHKLAPFMRPRIDGMGLRKYKNKNPQVLFSPALLSGSSLLQKIDQIQPDIVHIHWVQGGALGIPDIPKIRQPIVWTTHDDWLFTGGCHIKYDCQGYVQSCGTCPALGSTSSHDLSARVWQRKFRALEGISSLTVVGVSHWMTQEATKSGLLSRLSTPPSLLSLPNPLDTDVFAPVNKSVAKELMNLDVNEKVLLFGAVDPTTDTRKGFSVLLEALHLVSSGAKPPIRLLIFGASQPKSPPSFPFPTTYLGKLSDDLSLRIAYNAADCMVVPSLQEAFGQTASESLACGTPVVAFGHSGLLDIVDHQVNGYLAKPFSPEDLAHGIRWVLTHSNPKSLADASRKKALEVFSYSSVIPRYVQLYTDILSLNEKSNTR